MSVRSAGSGTVLYQADQAWTEHVKKHRQKLAGICGRHLNRPVRVQTIDGHTYEGTIVGTDGCHLHLMTRPTEHDHRFFGPYAANSILTLVLYELLVITLLI